jgi:glucose-6-phosphate isomerase
MRSGSGRGSAELFLGITEPARAGVRNGLRNLLEARGAPILDHPTAIGGRYSALTVGGLLPTRSNFSTFKPRAFSSELASSQG